MGKKEENGVTDMTDMTEKKDLEVSFFLSSNNLLKILNYLSDKENANYEIISKENNISIDNVRQIISNRYKEFFITYGKDESNKKLFTLSEKGKKYYEQEVKILTSRLTKDDYSFNQDDISDNNLKEEISKLFICLKPEKTKDFLIFDFMEIAEESSLVSDMLLERPNEMITLFNNHIQEKYSINLKFGLINIPPYQNITRQEIRAKHLNKLIGLSARVVSISSVKQLVEKVKYSCPSCESIMEIIQDGSGVIKEPKRCFCGRRGGFKELSRDINDFCRILLEDIQEKTDNPHSQRINAIIKGALTNDDNIKIFNQGNELSLIGVVKSVKFIINNQEKTESDYYFEVLSASTIEDELNLENFKEEEVDKIHQICKDINDDGLDRLINSFAPSVYGDEDIKKAIILQIVSSRNEPNKEVRSKPNLLLIGDPGIAKSVLGKYAVDVTQCSKRAVGGGSSAVGITATTIKEETSLGGYRLEPGAFVLAKDIFFLDEMNNLNDEEKPKLQEAMSERSVTINKASIHSKLPVVAGMLSCANPIEGSFDIEKKVFEQFNIPIPILNRFDLIFTLIDNVSTEKDIEIAKKMIRREQGKIKPEISKDFMKKLFYYIRHQEEPIITKETEKLIIDVYSEFRKRKTKQVMINPRFLESLLRLVKAHAKCRLSQTIEKKDVLECIKIINKSYYSEGGELIEYLKMSDD